MKKEKIYKCKKNKNSMIFPGDPSGLPDEFSNIIVFIDNAYLIRLKNYFFKKNFKYYIKKLKSFGVYVILWTYFERNRRSSFSRSNYLINSVDEFIKIDKKDFESCRINKKGEIR